MAKATITVEAFAAKDAETRTVTGHTITSVTLPVTPQKKDGNGGYVDNGDTVWYSAEFWDDHGQAVAHMVKKGTLVTVTGTLDVQTREKDGKTYINHVIGFGTIAVVIPKPKRGQGGSGSPASASSPEQWASEPPATPRGGTADVWATGQTIDGSEVPF